MTITSRILGWMWGLPAAETRDVVVDRDLQVPMPDGTVLLADHYHPRAGENRPTILIRTPYGRTALWGIMFGRPFAERGFQVLIQSCRGTFGSGGSFDPFHHEEADGLATLEWIERQPWFSGKLAMFGPSYLGFVQWAIAAKAGGRIQALLPAVTGSEIRSLAYPGGSYWLETSLFWVFVVDQQEKGLWAAMRSVSRAEKRLGAAKKQLPLRATDSTMTGSPTGYFQDWLAHGEPGDAWWEKIDFSGTAAGVTAPVHLVGGWYDLFMPRLHADYVKLREAGRNPYLTVGPWPHLSNPLMVTAVREAIAWFRAHLLGDRGGVRELPVRVFVMGAGEWRDFPSYPPPGHRPERWHLHPGGGLSTSPPPESEPDRYRYDPDDPTPSVGGAALSPNAGPKDNKALLKRSDVLVYTSAPMEADLDVIGPVRAELFVDSSLDHTDFFVRLCEVSRSGKTVNVCDGILRLTPGNPPRDERGLRKVVVELWPTAQRFKRGHRIRVLVASGAHPAFARNPGSGEPLAKATTLLAADQAVHHDPAHPSAIVLPVVPQAR